MPTGIDLRLRDGAGDDAFPELTDGRVVHRVANGGTLALAPLERGIAGGRKRIVLKLDLPDGSSVLHETSLRAFLAAADALRAFLAADG